MTVNGTMRSFGITVIDVMREQNVEITPSLSWSVGSLVRELYLQRYGVLPEKDLRSKTNGEGGTHCFAVYPPEMHADIVRIIRECEAEAARQLNFLWPTKSEPETHQDAPDVEEVDIIGRHNDAEVVIEEIAEPKLL